MIRSERTIHVPVSRQALWELLADTDGLDRELNLPPVRFDFRPRAEGGSHLRGEATFAGVTFRYDEEPYCWVRGARWSVRRAVENGPLRAVATGMTLADAGGSGGSGSGSSGGGGAGTEVTAWFEAEPRNPAARPVARAVADASAKGLAGVCRAFADYLTARAPTPYPRHSRLAPLHEERFRVRAGRLSSVEVAVADPLLDFLRHAPIEAVAEFRPYERARAFGVGRRALLEGCLQAVRAGILELRWRLLCPLCRAPGAGTGHLADLSRGEPHCPSCNIRFGPEFDRSVEVCFGIAPDLRSHPSAGAVYCVGGPSRSPHVRVQWYSRAGEAVEIPVELPEGDYRLRSPQSAAARDVRVAGTGSGEIVCRPDGDRATLDAPDGLPAVGTWRVANQCAWPVLLRAEEREWSGDVATAFEVTALQTFRDAFSSEVLSPGTEMAVRQVALLFTDLKGSTAMYARDGDAPSYARVRDHFDLLRSVLAAHGGSVVKTMGDAIMAAFPDPADAVTAGLEIQRRVADLPGALPVKVGVYAGPALAVNTDDRLDYFGQSVNRAARIQAQSVGGDVVIAASLTEDPRVLEIIEGVTAEPFLADLKGDSPQVPLLRLRPAPPAP